uniref:Uncharacterized protein n=1 Tax=Myotis myotis TaxID=51298 RepID=A0A7J7TIQ1_MYOMY|nr:hypothetical protein mMyoMyo1_009045 [Myotis myotis]
MTTNYNKSQLLSDDSTFRFLTSNDFHFNHLNSTPHFYAGVDWLLDCRQDSYVIIFIMLPGQVAQLVGALSQAPKGCGLDSQSGHIPRVADWIPGWGTYRRQLIDVDVSLSLPRSLKSINISLGKDFKKNYYVDHDHSKLNLYILYYIEM